MLPSPGDRRWFPAFATGTAVRILQEDHQLARTVYLFPGILGDDRRLRDFRSCLADRFRFDVLDYPGIRGPSAQLHTLGGLAARLAADIERRQGQGDLLLAGYSFGACVAFEVCRRLQQRGRTVERILLIDPPLPRMIFDLYRPWGDGGVPPRARHKHVGMLLTQMLSRFWLARNLAVAATGWMAPGRLRRLERVILKSLRERARRDTWDPEPILVPGLLALSAQFSGTTGEALKALSRGTEVAVVEASHIALLEGHALAALRDSILASAFSR